MTTNRSDLLTRPGSRVIQVSRYTYRGPKNTRFWPPQSQYHTHGAELDPMDAGSRVPRPPPAIFSAFLALDRPPSEFHLFGYMVTLIRNRKMTTFGLITHRLRLRSC